MLKLSKIRRVLALLFFVLITLLFLDFTGTIHTWFGWMAKVQFIPAVLALNVGVILLLVVLTLLFGRVYCSVICPLGVMQDIVAKIATGKKKMRYKYSKALTVLRIVVLVLFVAMFIFGVGSIVALLEPYSAFGRIASNLFAPLWAWGNNVLAYFAERADSYAFYSTEVFIRSIPIFAVAVITFVVIAILAARSGRTYCNTICPVGSILGFMSKFSLFKIRIDKDKCNSCKLCSFACKSSCIDAKAKSVDSSRCVSCFNCLEKCKKGAISFSLPSPKRVKSTAENNVAPVSKAQNTIEATAESTVQNKGRREFLTITTLLAGASVVKAQEMKVDGGFSVIGDKKIPKRSTQITPPGSRGAANFNTKCTGCQLCVSVCENHVLRPSTDMITFMQPEMSFEKGYCRPECVKCSEVCPTGAISLISRADKSAISIGTAVWIEKNCVVLTDGVSCGNCAVHCPTGAIQMIEKDGKQIPAVNTAKCIGCGACEYVCPAAPFSAIYVEGNKMHREI